MIPVLDLQRQEQGIRGEIDSALTRVVRSGRFILGAEVEAFERAFAEYCGVRFCIGVGSGTEALQIALRACGIGPGDEVVTVSLTSVATVAAIELAGARPVPVDVGPDRLTMDPDSAAAALSAKTRAILPVHLHGRPAELAPLLELAVSKGIPLIEDCAHAHGGRWRNKGAGATGDIGCFSFQSSKLMTSGEGGGIITSNLEYYERAQSYVNCGRASVTDTFRHRMIGFNYRITEFQAAVLEAQLERLPQQAKTRQANMNHFEKRLHGTPGLSFLKRDKRNTRVAAYQFVFKYLPEHFGGVPRAAFLGALEMEGIPCDGLFYEPVYRSALFPVDAAECPALSWGRPEPLDLRSMYRCPVSERAAYEEAVWLPHHIFLGTQKDAAEIADAVLKVTENIDELRALAHPAIERKGMSRAERPRVEKRQW